MISFLFFSARSAIFGIDVGAEKFRVSYTSPGNPIMMLLDNNERYFNEILTVVPKSGQVIQIINASNARSYDYYFNSENKAKKFPNRTIRYFSTLLSKVPSREFIKNIFSRQFYPTFSVLANNRVTFNGVLPEILLYHLFDRINQTIRSHEPQLKAERLYLAVPKFFMPQERKSIKSISHLHNFTTYIIDQSQALSYAFAYTNYRKIAKSELPLRVAFLDIGETNIQITVTEFKGKHEIHSQEIFYDYDNTIGGRDFDTTIYNLLLKYVSQKKLTMSDRELLLIESQKIKHRLSTNNEAFGYIDCSQPFYYNITRDSFLSETDPILEKIKKIIQKSPRVDIVHMIGGCSRMPSIQYLAKNAFKVNSLSFSINSEEAIAIGASYYGLSQSSSYKSLITLNHTSIDLYSEYKIINSRGVEFTNYNQVGQYLYIVSQSNIIPFGSNPVFNEGLISKNTYFTKTANGLYKFENSTKRHTSKWKHYFLNQQQIIYDVISERNQLIDVQTRLEDLVSSTKLMMKSSDIISQVCTAREISQLEVALNATDKWMMNQKEYRLDSLQKRLKNFEDSVSSILCRVENKEKIDTVLKNMREVFESIKIYIKANWMNNSKRPSRKNIRILLAMMVDTELWVEERQRMQLSLKDIDNPTLKWYLITRKVDIIINQLNKLKESLTPHISYESDESIINQGPGVIINKV